MSFINFIKVAGIKAADWLNEHHDPFDDFTRPAQPKTQESLAVKAFLFEQDLYDNFLIRGGTIVNYRIPLPLGQPLDIGDQALWHGIAAATEALKFRQSGSMTAPSRCAAFLQGLADQQPTGRLIRGMDETGRSLGDASNDQATGHLFGLYGLWKWGPTSIHDGAARLMDEWASNILANGHALVDSNGNPTTYGALIQGWKTDPLRLTLCLAIYSAAYVMTGDSKYGLALWVLMADYDTLVIYPKVHLWWIDKAYDTHRAAVHLSILADLNTDGNAGALFQQGLWRIRQITRKQGNIWVNALCTFGGAGTFIADRVLALKVLSEFEVEAKQYNVGRVNSNNPAIDKTIWNGEWVSRQPLPRWQVSAQDFFFQRNLYAIDFRQEGSPPDSRYNGLDFVAAYRMCLLTGILRSED